MADIKTLELLWDEADRQHQLEHRRLEAYRNRAGFLLAFIGVIITLEAAQSTNVLDDTNLLGNTDRIIAVASLGLGVLLTAIAGGLVLVGLTGLRGRRIESAELQAFNTDEWLTRTPEEVLGRRLATTIELVVNQRSALDSAQTLLGVSLAVLVAGLLAVAVNVGVFLERGAENPCVSPATSSQTTTRSSSASLNQSRSILPTPVRMSSVAAPRLRFVTATVMSTETGQSNSNSGSSGGAAPTTPSRVNTLTKSSATVPSSSTTTSTTSTTSTATTPSNVQKYQPMKTGSCRL